ncbi:unnamed protein product [Blepharisma stoltei]|uniref:Uncharacterized protein n=1 Tax=Blepharisma stoltei TaxID=1481888 RepID=A0AAU9J7Z2_9CILI|nr:unnamed protein product [Blepharisma stoltei]
MSKINIIEPASDSKRWTRKRHSNPLKTSKLSGWNKLSEVYTPKSLRKGYSFNEAALRTSSIKNFSPKSQPEKSPTHTDSLLIKIKRKSSKKSCCSEKDDFKFRMIASPRQKEIQKERMKSLESVHDSCERSLKCRNFSLPRLLKEHQKLIESFEIQKIAIQLFQDGQTSKIDHPLVRKHQESIHNRIRHDVISIKDEVSRLTDQARIDNKIYKLVAPSYSRKTLDFMKSVRVVYQAFSSPN